MKDSNNNEMGATGCVRSKLYPDTDMSEFPIRLDLLFRNDVFLRRMGETYAEGAAKYGAENWKKGFNESVYISHALEHIRLYMAGDTSEDHLAHSCWNFATLMWVQEHKPELMDLSQPEILSPAQQADV